MRLDSHTYTDVFASWPIKLHKRQQWMTNVSAKSYRYIDLYFHMSQLTGFFRTPLESSLMHALLTWVGHLTRVHGYGVGPKTHSQLVLSMAGNHRYHVSVRISLYLVSEKATEPLELASELKLNEKIQGLNSPQPEAFGASELIYQINNFIGTTAIPNLRKFLIDNDKVAAACTNIVYYIVNPAMKGKSR